MSLALVVNRRALSARAAAASTRACKKNTEEAHLTAARACEAAAARAAKQKTYEQWFLLASFHSTRADQCRTEQPCDYAYIVLPDESPEEPHPWCEE